MRVFLFTAVIRQAPFLRKSQLYSEARSKGSYDAPEKFIDAHLAILCALALLFPRYGARSMYNATMEIATHQLSLFQ